jgi:hypothetical protein
VSPADGTATPSPRELSKTLFGSAYRVEVAAAIAKSGSGIVCVSEIAEELGVRRDTVVANEFTHFVHARQLARRDDASGASRFVFYSRVDDVFFKSCARLLAHWTETGASAPAHGAPQEPSQ